MYTQATVSVNIYISSCGTYIIPTKPLPMVTKWFLYLTYGCTARYCFTVFYIFGNLYWMLMVICAIYWKRIMQTCFLRNVYHLHCTRIMKSAFILFSENQNRVLIYRFTILACCPELIHIYECLPTVDCCMYKDRSCQWYKLILGGYPP